MGLYVGDTKYKVMVGNQKADFVVPLSYCVNWNQYMQNGDFSNGIANFSIDNLVATVQNNILHVEKTQTSTYNFVRQQITNILGHKCLVSANVSNLMNNTTVRFNLNNADIVNITKVGNNYRYIYTPNSNNTRCAIRLYNMSVGDSANISEFMVYDLTQMFGAGNEPSSTLDFVSWLDENNLSGYQDYNTGEIRMATKPNWITY